MINVKLVNASKFMCLLFSIQSVTMTTGIILREQTTGMYNIDSKMFVKSI